MVCLVWLLAMSSSDTSATLSLVVYRCGLLCLKLSHQVDHVQLDDPMAKSRVRIAAWTCPWGCHGVQPAVALFIPDEKGIGKFEGEPQHTTEE